jgi:lactoylglutathione lyase
VRSPDQVSNELLQKGAALAPAAPWNAMPNVGQW